MYACHRDVHRLNSWCPLAFAHRFSIYFIFISPRSRLTVTQILYINVPKLRLHWLLTNTIHRGWIFGLNNKNKYQKEPYTHLSIYKNIYETKRPIVFEYCFFNLTLIDITINYFLHNRNYYYTRIYLVHYFIIIK